MAINPDSSPIDGLETVGDHSLGTQESGKQKGKKWQMGIAVPLKNRKFEYGTVVNYRLSTDNFGNNSFLAPDIQGGLSALETDANKAPSNNIQYGDRLLLGPSSVQEFSNYKEAIRVSAVKEQVDLINEWSGGGFFSLDRRNKYRFNSTDKVSALGSGKGSAWEVHDFHLMTAGLKKGFASLNRLGQYSPSGVGLISKPASAIAPNHILLQIQLPSASGFDASTSLGLGGGPAVFNSLLGLGPWRDPTNADQDNTWDWRIDATKLGEFRYLQDPNISNEAHLAYSSNADPDSFALTGVELALLTGFYHSGGHLKDTAQALFSMVNPLSVVDGGDYKSLGVFTQYITDSIEDFKDMSYNPLVSGTHYRLGLTWKGTLSPGGADSAGSQLWAKFQWGPIARAGEMISTSPLLDSANNEADWSHHSVSGFVPHVSTDQLDSEKNIKVQIINQVVSPQAYADGRDGRGSEMLSYVDNIWLEHQGDIPGATDKGYIEIDHFPEMGTLTVNQEESVQTINLKLSDGSSRFIDPSGNLYKKLYVIEGDFLRVKEEVYNQLMGLLEWQKRGYKLTLHPFLPQVPHCLVGHLNIERVSKNHWDLSRFNFRFRFTETD